MNYYKICECQNILQFDKPYMCPDPCPYCGRMTQNYITYRGEPPISQKVDNNKEINVGTIAPLSSTVPPCDSQQQVNMSTCSTSSYYLVAADGRYRIEIPADGGIVGRTGLGAEQLAYNNAVSKQHLKVMINKRLGVFIEDISSFGTRVNGEELIKGNRVLVKAGDHITLYNEELILVGR